jgi:hypothetical protein
MPVQYEDALAYLQKADAQNGTSVFEHLTRVVGKVGACERMALSRGASRRLLEILTHRLICEHCPFISQLLEEQPDRAVDLLEASLLAKKSDFSAHTKESLPLVPISVSGRRTTPCANSPHDAHAAAPLLAVRR